MANAGSGTPLRLGPDAGLGPHPTDPAAARKAYAWSDVTLPRHSFPFTARASVRDGTMPTMRSKAAELLTRAGFPVVLDVPAELPLLVRSHPAGLPVHGIVVGERGLRWDRARQRSALRKVVLSVVLLGAGVCLAVAFLSSLLALVSLVPIAPGLYGVARFGPAYGAFDSEVAYSATVRAQADTERPLPIEILVGAAPVASANWSSDAGNGRSFQSVLPGDAALRDVPATIVRDLLAGPRGVTRGRSATSR